LLIPDRFFEESSITFRNFKWNNDRLRNRFLNMKLSYDLETSSMKQIFKLKERISRNKHINVHNLYKINESMIKHFKK